MILNDRQIKELSLEQDMISPFNEHQVRTVGGRKVISYGLSSYGYDIRCSNEFKIFTNVGNSIVDPLNFDENAFVDYTGDRCVIPPNSFVLARSMEVLRIPRNVLAVCLGKSSYARCGLVLNVTPLEPEWFGTITLEISNTTPLPAVVHAGQGIAQLVFHTAEPCDVSYADRNGKYMGQHQIQLPIA